MNAKELILAKVNAGNKLAKMYLFLITIGMDINDIVSFMTSPVASFIDSITEENIFSGNSIDINSAIDLARGRFLDANGEIIYRYVKKYGKLKMLLVRDAYILLGLNNKKDKNTILEDCNEFLNVLEGANEFSNFGRLLGMNLGLPTSKVELLKLVSFIQSILTDRIKIVSEKADSKLKELLVNIPTMNVERWLEDSEYRNIIAEQYNKVKKCINIFDAFTYIELFDSIRELLSVIVQIDKNLSFKSKAFDAVFKEAKKHFKYFSETYLKNMLRLIDSAIITDFILRLNIYIPVKAKTKYLLAGSSFGTFKEDGNLYLDNRDSIASFKYIFENVIIPNLKKGITIEINKEGKFVEKQYTDLQNNNFISSLLRSTELKVPIYKVALNMLTIKDSTESLKKYLLYTSGLLALSKYYYGKLNLADLFMLYNLIINKNLYGANRFTTLFDPFISRNLSIRLLAKYFDYLGKVDYFGVPRLDIDKDFNEANYSPDIPIININYKDILISAASVVHSENKQTDPYIIKLTSGTPIIMERNKNKYTELLGFLVKGKNESTNAYLERINNERNYYALGGLFSDFLQNQLNIIEELKDVENIISYMNNFVRDGLLTILKDCE